MVVVFGLSVSAAIAAAADDNGDWDSIDESSWLNVTSLPQLASGSPPVGDLVMWLISSSVRVEGGASSDVLIVSVVVS